MGPTIAGLDKLLQMPTGCGEQNMVYFAPDVFIYKYLESTNQENAAIKEKALKFMEIGMHLFVCFLSMLQWQVFHDMENIRKYRN